MAEQEPVSVIINVYNEADTIEQEVREIHSEIVARLPGSELIVAEDGSTDGTKEILARLQAELGIIHSTSPERKGYARAFRDALALVRNPYVFFSDSGGKQDFREFWKLYEYRRQYGVVSGIRAGRSDQWYRRLMTWTYNFVLRKYFHVELRDADSGFRLYQTAVMRKIGNEPWINRYLVTSELAPAGDLQRLPGEGSAGGLSPTEGHFARPAAQEDPPGDRPRAVQLSAAAKGVDRAGLPLSAAVTVSAPCEGRKPR